MILYALSGARGHTCLVIVLVIQLEKKRLLYVGEKSYIGLLGKFWVLGPQKWKIS